MWMRTLGAAFALVTCVVVAGPVYGAGNFVAQLSGDEEVPAPAVDTLAVGNAIFKFRGEGLSYKLIVANIDNVVAAHIHCAPVGSAGSVGVTLFASAPVSFNGILASGPILAPNVGNACGWLDVEDIIDALLSGDTYVNVHTLQSLSGEIRGQIR